MIWNWELLSFHTTENARPYKRVGEGGRKEKIKARWSKVIFVFPWQEEMKARENMGQTSSTWPFFFSGERNQMIQIAQFKSEIWGQNKAVKEIC